MSPRLDFDAPVLRVSGFIAVERLILPVAVCFKTLPRHAAPRQFRRHRLGAAFRKLLIAPPVFGVGRDARESLAAGMPVHENARLRQGAQRRAEFFDLPQRVRLQRRRAEIEQNIRKFRLRLHVHAARHRRVVGTKIALPQQGVKLLAPGAVE